MMKCVEKVDLTISAKGLLKVGTFGAKTDAFAVLRLENSNDYNILEIIGYTDVMHDNSDPDWRSTFTVDYHFEKIQTFVVQVYHHDGSNYVTDLRRHTLLGEAQFKLSQLMCACGQKLLIQMTAGKNGVSQGQVEVRGEALTSSRDELVLTLSANDLVNKGGFFGTSDPFVTISRLNEDGSYSVVFSNKHIDNTLNPRWAETKIPTASLCNNDLDRPLRFEVWDWERNGRHVSMGQAVTSMRALLGNGTGKGSVCLPVLEAEKKGKRGYSNSGTLLVNNCRLQKNPTFTDYITGGLDVSLVVAIDFTMSNGDPASPQSLHHLNPPGGATNAYETAIRAVCTVLQPYDSDQMYPVYGFGAKLRLPDGQYSPAQHCFPVYGGGAEVAGLGGILQAYRDCLGSVMLSGPTLFGPLITAAALAASNAKCSQENQKYTILLILTDGMVNDLDQTIAAVVAASYTPLSIVIVGVGSADFSGMHALDSDNQLLRSGANEAARDIVQFVSFQEAASQGEANLAAQVLAEIPDQVLKFMHQQGISPGARK